MILRRGSAWLDRVATGRLLVALLALELALLGAENALYFPLSVPYMRRATGRPYLDMCAFCSPARIRENLDAFGDAGRHLQLWLMATIDVAIPVTSAAFGLVALTFLGRGLAWRWVAWLRLLPVGAMLLDFAENLGIVALVLAYPREAEVVATLTGLLTGLKSCAYAATAFAIVALFLRGGWIRPRTKVPA